MAKKYKTGVSVSLTDSEVEFLRQFAIERQTSMSDILRMSFRYWRWAQEVRESAQASGALERFRGEGAERLLDVALALFGSGGP